MVAERLEDDEENGSCDEDQVALPTRTSLHYLRQVLVAHTHTPTPTHTLAHPF